MKIISIETSTEACSAALHIDNEVIERFEIAPSKHSQLILPMIESLLNEAHITLSQLDVIAFGRGPGSFTGLRIAAGVIQGIALGADLPVAPVSTLATLAQYAYEEKRQVNILAALDARMSEVYWGIFQFDSKGELHRVDQEVVCPPVLITKPNSELATKPWFGVGPGWTTYSPELQSTLEGIKVDWEINVFPRARYVATLARQALLRGNVVAPQQAIPVYLRDNIAKKKAAK